MSYNCLAKYYQLFTDKDCDYTLWSQYLYAVIKSHGATKGVDLACGTGKMTRLLAKCGLDIVGCDNSIEMLTEARAQGRGKYICQDMLQLQLPNKVQFVTIVNDGVNYIKGEQLAQLFGNISDNLTDGGVLIFDISSSYKLTNIVGNNVFYHDLDDVTCLWTNKLYSNRVIMDIVLFDKVKDNQYNRQDEQHTQYIHSNSSIVELLHNSGFDVYTCDCYSSVAVSDSTQRITYIATKRGKYNG